MIPSRDASARPTYCQFRCQEQDCALDVDAVVEVIEPGHLVRVPLGPPPLLGLCAYRGGVVPVAWTGEGERPAVYESAGEVAVLILRSRNGPWGLAIDRAGVSVVADAWPRRYPEPEGQGFLSVIGEAERGGERLRVVDAERSWDQLRSIVTNWYGELSDGDSIAGGPCGAPGDPAGSAGDLRGGQDS